MERTLSSEKFIGLVVLVALVVIGLWFAVPAVQKQIATIRNTAHSYIIKTDIPADDRAKVEQDIRDTEDEIKRGDTKGAKTLLAQYARVGIDFETIGRLDLAIDAYTKAAEADPTSFIPYANMGSVYETAKDYEKAKNAFQEAIAKNRTEPSNYEKLAELYWYKLNEVAVARGVYLEGLMGTNQENGIVRAYASFLEQNNYTSEALQYWNVVLSQAPGDQSVKDRIKALTPAAPAPAPTQKPAPAPSKKK